MRTFRVCALGIGLWAAAGGLAAAERPQDGHDRASRTLPQKYALLIAIDDYAEIQKLKYCNADMDGLRAVLVDAGLPAEHVTVLRDKAPKSQYVPCKSNIEKQLELLLATAGEQDLVVVAFSGHGVHVGGASYLCPMDAQLDRAAGTLVTSTLVPLDWVYKVLEACRAQQKLLLVDACRNDPNPGNTRGVAGMRSATDFAAALRDPPQGILVLAACTPGQVSMEDPQFGHGVFMYNLTKGLEGDADRNHDGKVSLLELYQFAEVKTKTHVRLTFNVVQTPELSGKISGDYEIASVPRRLTAPLPGPTPESPRAPATDGDGTAAAIAQADEFYRHGEFDQAISAYDTIIMLEPGNKALHLKRGAAHLANGAIDKAVIDYQLGGMPVPLTVAAERATLRDGERVTGTVRQGQTLSVTRITRLGQSDWLWVASVDGSDAARGWVQKEAVTKKPAPPPASAAPNYAASPEGGGSRSANAGSYDPRAYEPEKPESPATRALQKVLDKKYDGLQRAEDRGAPAGRVRASERQVDVQQRIFDSQPRVFEGRRGR